MRVKSETKQYVKLAAVLGAVALAILPVPASTASGAETVTFGFTSEAYGAPVSVLLYEPASGIPVDPGKPHLEATFSYTKTQLETGPKSRALASSIWPGEALGDGFSTLCECPESWRVRAVAQQPGGETDAAQEIPEFDAGMQAHAKDYNAHAEADGGGAPSPQIPLSMANGSSQSRSTVEKGFAVARTVASAKDVKLLAGIINIDSVVTRLEALSNAKGAKASGVTTVNGLVIGGNGYTIDGKGLHPVQDGKPADSPLPAPPKQPPGAAELKKELGISFHLDEHKSSAVSTTATREASGLRISIETAKLRNRIDEGPLYPILEELPPEFDEIQAPLYQLLSSAPRIDFVFGRAFVESASVKPLVFPKFDLPPMAPLAPLPPAAGPATSVPPATTTGPPLSAGGAGVSSVGGGTPSTSTVAPEAAPVASRPSAQQPLAAPPADLLPAANPAAALFAGLPPGLVIGAVALSLLAARGLSRFAGLAMAGGGGGLCEIGSPKNVPNLRD